MITVPDIKADTLAEYYRILVAAQENAHGRGYCSHHDVIREKAKECRSYAELGVKQGTTLACAIIAGYTSVAGVDSTLAHIRPFEHLFWHKLTDAYRLTLIEADSRHPTIAAVDFLLIDTQHTPAHVKAELAAHGPNTRKWMLIHDTAAVPALHVLARSWADANGWLVAESSFQNVGWTLLKRL